MIACCFWVVSVKEVKGQIGYSYRVLERADIARSLILSSILSIGLLGENVFYEDRLFISP